MSSSRARIIVTGLVQGVYYRADTQREAARMGLTGWVRNRRDGSVEIVAEGKKGDIEKLVQWCRLGPPGAVVDNVEVEWSEPAGGFDKFSIRY